MNAAWWDDTHTALGPIAGRLDLLDLAREARHFARLSLPRLLADTPAIHGWGGCQARVLAALDGAGLTGLVAGEKAGLTLPLAVSVWELASIDAGAATCSLSGNLAQMPVRDFGTEEQRQRYLHTPGLLHGALCLTEQIPGAGADALILTGRMIGETRGIEPMLRVRKRGRFTSHMDFASFVLAAVEGDGDSVHRSGLVILEPGDEGRFERGAAVRKLGHRFASTTDPTFDLLVPARRLVGGFSQEAGAIVPCFDHRQLLEPALRRMRALLALMTAAKALTTVREAALEARGAASVGIFQSLADLWAAGEAARALGFSAAQLCDALDRTTDPGVEDSRLAALYSPAAKLFSSSALPPLLVQLAGWSVSGSEFSLRLQARLVDAQIEEMHMGPSAVQRRLVSAIVTGGWFLALFRRWCEELETFSSRLPVEGTRSLTAAMRLWIWTLDWLRQMHDCHGAHLLCDARQSVGFALTDSFCALLAARSLALELLQAQADPAWNDASTSVFRDIFTLAAGRAAARVPNVCAEQILGWGPRFVLPAEQAAKFRCLCAQLYVSLDGVLEAQDRIVSFLASAPMENL